MGVIRINLLPFWICIDKSLIKRLISFMQMWAIPQKSLLKKCSAARNP